MEKVSNKPIRVLQVGMHDKIGGVETFLMSYYRNIDRNKVQFDFISSFNKMCFEDEIKQLCGIIYNVTSVKRNPLKYYFQLKKIMVQNNYQIVHINMLSKANILPIIAAKRAHVKKIIIHSHNNNTPKGLLRKILDKINGPFINFANEYWACSNLAGNWMFKNKEFKVIPNAIDLNRFLFNKKDRNHIRDELNINDELVLGHVGRFSYQKNHEFLINLFEKYCKINSNSKLLLIGEGEEKEKIIQLANRKEVVDKIIFLSPKLDIEKYYSAMDIFLLPSRFEGLGIVLLEAQANGLPCISSDMVPYEVKINKEFSFLKLDKMDKWIDIINEYKFKRISVNINNFKCYDIVSNSEELMNLYLNL